MEAQRLENIAEIDERVKKVAIRLRGEGLKFELEFPNENIILLRAGGKELNFTKLETYEIKNEKGEIFREPIEMVIEKEIREFGK